MPTRCNCNAKCGCALTAFGTSGLDVEVSGAGTSEAPYVVQATPIIDPDPTNQLVEGEDGLYVPPTDALVIEDEGTPLAARSSLNFVGDSVVATDDAVNDETDVTINHLPTGVHTAAQPVTVRKNTGADVGTRPRLNFIEGTNITITTADDAGSGEVDITIAAAGDAVDAITVRKNTGADVGTRPRINLIEGSNVTITVADDAGDNEVDITIASSAPTTIAANRQTGSYTLALSDAGLVVEMNVAGANNLTVPPNSTVAFPVGTVLELLQYGAGQTTIVAGAGVTLRSPGGKLKIAAQYGAASLRKIATDEWAVEGNITT